MCIHHTYYQGSGGEATADGRDTRATRALFARSQNRRRAAGMGWLRLLGSLKS